MSLFLALDTATDAGSVAVGRPGVLAAEIIFGDRRHAAALVPAIEEALRLAGASFPDLTGIVLADGPGSFTGLRIGFATVQGLVREHASPRVLTAPSLIGAAWLASRFADGPVAALYDALRGEVFAVVCRFHNQAVEILLSPRLTTVAALRDASVRPGVVVGDGAVAHAEEVRAWTGRDPVGPPGGAPRASALLELLAVGGATREVSDPTAWEPDYGRPAEAQVRWERKHGRPLPDSTGGRD
ncbi:MAG: tRNA (adenosine(37)-N6)-threonylcarbamoyltransferase complex dimerization subunit type 1 TsaB [Gemmatimonadetes bacterium]|nr:tRNA (adenosine(37)-N6)-threonylcarbamoyltransferase complex dimerization subunit type 1 TsaB [Gemmatimonadota bacterium]